VVETPTGPQEPQPELRPAWVRAVPDEAAVAVIAQGFAAAVETPSVIYLEGDLGAGKTTFARAYVHALGFEGYVKSPTYGLLEVYEAGGQQVLHLDLYRIEDPEELEFLSLRDLFGEHSVLLVEWPDRGGALLPAPDLVLTFAERGDSRYISCEAQTERGARLARKLDQAI
jgi:tRNA threonylcarbamoyladenosine biosynthesis protein TsaE